MLKHLGLSSEEVCEIGKWKNVAAFTSHYLRLGASTTVGEKLQDMVHSVSPLESAEPDLTCTTGKTDLGGNVREGGAQDNGETRFSRRLYCAIYLKMLLRCRGLGLLHRFSRRRLVAYDPVAQTKVSSLLQSKAYASKKNCKTEPEQSRIQIRPERRQTRFPAATGTD